MNKKLLITTLVMTAFAIAGNYNIVNAQEPAAPIGDTTQSPAKTIPAFKYFGPGPQINPNVPHPQIMKNRKPFSKAEIEAKKAEFEKRLKLTDEQKKTIEENRIKDREKIKPILDEIHSNQMELQKIKEDKSLSEEEKDKKIFETKKNIKDLRDKANLCRKENMQNFESVLTEKQKKEFEKIKTEQKKLIEKKKKEFAKTKKEGKYHHQFNKPVQPKPAPVKE